ncbi:MAG: four helix bundle protein [Patescibacteria group bacterium]
MTNKQISKACCFAVNKLKNRDIHERIYNFVIAVLRLLADLPKNNFNLIIIDQCGRAVTSVGANDQEADACESRRDFIAKYSLVKKEIKEVNYWLRLIFDLNKDFQTRVAVIQQEGKEILLIVSSIIKNTKKSKKI